MDMLIPASKIANKNTGKMVGVVTRENTEHYGKYDTNTFRCKVSVDMVAVKEEQSQYRDLPRFYTFGTPDEGEVPDGSPAMGVRGVEGMVGQ